MKRTVVVFDEEISPLHYVSGFLYGTWACCLLKKGINVTQHTGYSKLGSK